MQFGVLITDSSGKPVQYDPTYFTIKMIENTSYGHGLLQTINTTDLGIYDWSKDFPFVNEFYDSLGLNGSLIWPQNKNFKVSGNYFSDSTSTFSIKLYRCVGPSICHSPSEIDNKIKNTQISILIYDWYVNFNDYENPIKPYVDDVYSYQLAPGFKKQLKLYVKLNEVELNDNYVLIDIPKKFNFIDVDRFSIDVFAESSDGQIFDVSVRMDKNKDIYKRIVFSLLDLLGLVGGFYQILFIIFESIVKYLSVEILLSSVLRRLYFTNKSKPELQDWVQVSTQLTRFHRNNKIEELKVRSDMSNSNNNNNLRFDESKTPSDINVSVASSQNRNLISDQQNASILSHLKNVLLNRRKYKASSCHKILTLFPRWIWKNKAILRK